jgi:GntR family galactonate operon transcriptional repressor
LILEERVLRKPRVHDTVVRTLALRVLRGEYPVGAMLPSESELCRELNVSRSALREAVKVLGEKGLITPRPRAGTIVRPRADWHMLDHDLLNWSMDSEPDPQFVFSLLEARQIIEPAAARLAAFRGTVSEIGAISDALEGMRAATKTQDHDGYSTNDIAFHGALLSASQNVVFKLMAPTLGTALAYTFKMPRIRNLAVGSSFPDHEMLFELVRKRDGDGAFACMSRLLTIAMMDRGLSSSPPPADPAMGRVTA